MIPDGWSIDQFENGNIMFSHPQHGGLCIAPGNAVHALCTALRRSEQERSEEERDAAKCDAAFDRWYAAQRHQLTNEQVCRLIWTRGWNAAIDTAMAKGNSK